MLHVSMSPLPGFVLLMTCISLLNPSLHYVIILFEQWIFFWSYLNNKTYSCKFIHIVKWWASLLFLMFLMSLWWIHISMLCTYFHQVSLSYNWSTPLILQESESASNFFNFLCLKNLIFLSFEIFASYRILA